MLVSVIIPTYNDADILEVSLDYIELADIPENFEFIVVDNNSTDNSSEVIKARPLFKYVFEKNQGVSHAKNRGVKESKGEWLYFLDSDGKVRPDIFSVVKDTILNNDYLLFHGIYGPWHLDPKPKWFRDEWATYPLIGSKELRPNLKGEFLTGGNMVVRRKELLELGCFRTDLGVKGTELNYGEDTYVQMQFLRKGWKAGINPKMYGLHRVDPRKYQLSWHLDSYKKKGITHVRLHNLGYLDLPKIALMQIFYTLYATLTGFAKMIIRGNYYFENWYLDILRNPYFLWGLVSELSKKSNQSDCLNTYQY